MAGWLFHKANSSFLSRSLNRFGLGRTDVLGELMIVDGEEWHMRWFVLSTRAIAADMVDTADTAEARIAEPLSLNTTSLGELVPLQEIIAVHLTQRPGPQGMGLIYANFELVSARRKWEMAAASEEDARDWVEHLRRALLDPGATGGGAIQV